MKLRKCLVTFDVEINGLKCEKLAYFHRWYEKAWAFDPILKGQVGGQMQKMFGIVEYEDGTVDEVYPKDIRFIDQTGENDETK